MLDISTLNQALRDLAEYDVVFTNSYTAATYIQENAPVLTKIKSIGNNTWEVREINGKLIM